MSVRRGTRIGIDVGSVRVGVARSDPDGLMAVPVETVPRRSKGTDGQDMRRIVELVGELEPIEVVVGLPRSMSGGEGPAATAVRAYATGIARRVAPVPVRLVDERLSTVTANRSLLEAGVGGRRRRPVVDQAAAVVILQSALDTERSSGTPAGVVLVPAGEGPGRRDQAAPGPAPDVAPEGPGRTADQEDRPR